MAEAERLSRLVRGLQDDPDVAKRPEEFTTLLRESVVRTQEFETGLRAKDPSDELSSRLSAVGASCKACHARYRDNR